MIKLAELIRNHKQEFLYSGQLDEDQFSAFTSLRICRTAEAKGALYACNDCDSLRFLYHSCGNRFCPNCQNHKSSLWLHRQKQRLLPCDYFMITFTLPEQLRNIARKRLREFYDTFFDCSSQAIKEMCQSRLKGDCGMIGVLHTNSRTLAFHPHIHYIVPGIVLNQKQNTVKKITTKFFLHHQALAKLFRGKFLARLKELGIDFPSYLYNKKWNLDCSQKGNGSGVFEYLSRYLVRGVVSEKALNYKEAKVELTYQNSKTKNLEKIQFEQIPFLKRLARHVLPKGLWRIRSYGFLAPAAKKKLTRLQLLLRMKIPEEEPPPAPEVKCLCCSGTMTLILRKVDEEWLREKSETSPQIRAPPQLAYS